MDKRPETLQERKGYYLRSGIKIPNVIASQITSPASSRGSGKGLFSVTGAYNSVMESLNRSSRKPFEALSRPLLSPWVDPWNPPLRLSHSQASPGLTRPILLICLYTRKSRGAWILVSHSRGRIRPGARRPQWEQEKSLCWRFPLEEIFIWMKLMFMARPDLLREAPWLALWTSRVSKRDSTLTRLVTRLEIVLLWKRILVRWRRIRLTSSVCRNSWHRARDWSRWAVRWSIESRCLHFTCRLHWCGWRSITSNGYFLQDGGNSQQKSTRG